MAQWLRELTLSEDLAWIPSSHMVSQDCLQIQFQWILQVLFDFKSSRHTHGKHIYRQTYKIKINIFKEMDAVACIY